MLHPVTYSAMLSTSIPAFVAFYQHIPDSCRRSSSGGFALSRTASKCLHRTMLVRLMLFPDYIDAFNQSGFKLRGSQHVLSVQARRHILEHASSSHVLLQACLLSAFDTLSWRHSRFSAQADLRPPPCLDFDGMTEVMHAGNTAKCFRGSDSVGGGRMHVF